MSGAPRELIPESVRPRRPAALWPHLGQGPSLLRDTAARGGQGPTNHHEPLLSNRAGDIGSMLWDCREKCPRLGPTGDSHSTP